jgi:hypothetical protein
METDKPEKPNAHSLLARVTASGLADAVFSALEAGRPIREVAELCKSRGVDTSPAAVHSLKRAHLHHWSARRIVEEAAKEGIVEPTIPATVRRVLLTRIGRLALDTHTLEGLRVVVPLFSDWTRSNVAEMAEARASRDSLRRFALRLEDLLADEQKLRELREAREKVAGEGVEKRVEAIIRTLWGEEALLGREAA